MAFMKRFQRMMDHEATPGVLLMLASVLALIVANSPLAGSYTQILQKDYIGVTYNGEGVEKPVLLWINDGLMAIFFFLIGLELKYELLEGKLKNARDVVLPGAAALGGMALPAIIYAWINRGQPSVAGWAIPAATDIAFALGILALVGKNAPASLKVFLLTLAILDDIGAILIIAVFYTAELKVNYLLLAMIPLAIMILRLKLKAHRSFPTILLGIVMWYFVLKSGVHATLAGVVTAFCIPLYDRFGKSPLHSIEHALTPYVNFAILPLFAFANAGVSLAGVSLALLGQPIPLGIIAGLIIGKQLGVFGATFLLVKMKLARIPYGANWLHIYGISCLAGVGFTMSLFIGGLTFAEGPEMDQVRLGVLVASFISGVAGFVALRLANARQEEPEAQPA